jgi:hypothetical protein
MGPRSPWTNWPTTTACRTYPTYLEDLPDELDVDWDEDDEAPQREP